MIIVNIAEKINTLKLLADEEKGLIKALTIQLIILNSIDSCEDLRDIEKFNYLHSYLEGEAFTQFKVLN